MMPLTIAKSGDVKTIKKIVGRTEVRKHLEALGLIAGEEVTVISKLAGSLILNVRGTRIGLDQNLANYIMI